MGLHNGRLAIDIDDESWQTVAFAMDEAVDVAALAFGEVEGKAQGVGFAEACGPEGFVNRFALEGEHAHSDGTNLVVPNGQKVALGIVNLHPFALL